MSKSISRSFVKTRGGRFGSASPAASGVGGMRIGRMVAQDLEQALVIAQQDRRADHEKRSEAALRGIETHKSNRLGEIKPGTFRKRGITLAGKDYSK